MPIYGEQSLFSHKRNEDQSTFSHTRKVANNDINGSFLFPCISSFLHYFNLKMLINVKLGLPFKVADFVVLFNFEWHGENKVGNIVILVLWKGREELYRRMKGSQEQRWHIYWTQSSFS